MDDGRAGDPIRERARAMEESIQKVQRAAAVAAMKGTEASVIASTRSTGAKSVGIVRRKR